MEDARDSVTSVDILGPEIMSGSVDGCIRNYDVRKGKLVVDNMMHAVTSCRFTSDNHCVLVSSLDSTLRLLDKSSGDLLNDYTGHKNTQYRLQNALSFDDNTVFSGSEVRDEQSQKQSIFVWDLLEQTILQKIPTQHSQPLNALCYHADKHMLLAASFDGGWSLFERGSTTLT